VQINQDLKEKISTVIELAEKRKIAIHKNTSNKRIDGIIDLMEYEQGEEEKKYNDMLYEYLISLDLNEIKIIQTIMYIGRDYSEKEAEGMSPDTLFEEMYNGLRFTSDKHVEIDPLMTKVPTGDYLKRGMKLLKIE
jgi:phage gp29-like protein